MVVGVDQHPAGSEADAYLEHSNGAGVESVLGDGTLHGHGGSDCVGGSGREALIPSPVRRNTVSWWAATATASISSWRVRSASPKSSPKRDRSSLEPTMSVNKIAPVLTVAPTQVMATVVAEPPSRRAAEPPSRRAAEPPSRRAAGLRARIAVAACSGDAPDLAEVIDELIVASVSTPLVVLRGAAGSDRLGERGRDP